MEYQADIIDNKNNTITTFRELIDKGIRQWEDFYINNLRSLSAEILERRERKSNWIKKYKEFLEAEQFAMKEVSKPVNWKPIHYKDIKEGFILRMFNKESKQLVFSGIALPATNTNEIILYNQLDNGDRMEVKPKEHLWMWLATGDIEKNEKIYKYYYGIDYMKEFAKRGRFGDQ